MLSCYYATTERLVNIPDVPRQRLGKHIPAATNLCATMEILLETGCFCMVCAKELS
jgi:hypothetical protein